MSSNNNVIDVIVRQTDYTKEKAIEKLIEHNNNVLAVVREYMGVQPKQNAEDNNKSTNQQIYGEIRNLMDDAARRYNAKKEYERRKEEYIKYMQASKVAEESNENKS